MLERDTKWITVARLLRPQGRKGELLADLLTDFPDRFAPNTKVFLAPPSSENSKAEPLSLEIESSWLPQGRNQGRIVLGFTSVHTIEAAERLGGLDVLIPEQQRMPLTDGSIYIEDLVGCTLHDRGVPVGTVREVQFMTTSDGKRRLEQAAPLLTVELPSGEALIPFVTEFIESIDLPGKRLMMNLPQGLIELNLKPTPKQP